MNFGQSFTYVFKDPDWIKKVVIMGLVSLIPVLGQFVLLGWIAEIIRRVVRVSTEPSLPNLEFGKQLGDGFKLFVVALLYSLPIILLSIPLIIVLSIPWGDEETYATIIGISSVCFSIFSVIFGVFVGFMLPAAYARTALEDSIGAGLKLGEVFKLVKSALPAYLMVFLGSIVVGFISPLGSIACGIGVLLTMVYGQAVMAHLYGQAYNQASGTKTTPLSYPPPVEVNIPPAI